MKDTMQLAAYAHHNFDLGQSAMFINEGLASFVVEQLKTRMNNSLVGRRIGILGMAFKAGVMIASYCLPKTATKNVAENIRLARAGKPLKHQVDRSKGY